MKNRTLTIILCLLFVKITTAQIFPINDTSVCFHFVLKPITGINLSPNTAYYTAQNGSGIKYLPGDTITKPTSLFAYDLNRGFEECFFVRVITNTPKIDAPDDTKVCNQLTLPQHKGDHLTPSVTYSSHPNGEGTFFLPGHTFYTSTTIYIYDGIDGCNDAVTLPIEITREEPFINLRDSIFYCEHFVFPYNFIPTNSTRIIYTSNANETYKIGDTTAINGEYIFSVDYGNCEYRDTFNIYNNKKPFVVPINDTFACDLFLIDVQNYTTSELQPWSTSSGSNSAHYIPHTIYTSGTVCIHDGDRNSACEAKECFYVKIVDKTGWTDSIHTFNLCPTKSTANINPYIQQYGFVAPYYIESTPPGFNISNGFVDFENMNENTYDVKFIRKPEHTCDQKGDTLFARFNLVSNCDNYNNDSIILLDEKISNCYAISQLDLVSRELIFPGGKYYTHLNKLVSPGGVIPRDGSATDTFLHYVVYPKRDNTFDTLRIVVPAAHFIDIKPISIVGDSSLCYGSCLEVTYPIVENQTRYLLNSAFVTMHNASTNTVHHQYNGWSIYGAFNNFHICFSGISLNSLDFNVDKENTDFFLVIRKDGLSAHSISGYENCLVDFSSDTIYFSTKEIDFIWHTKTMCPGEIEIIGSDTFNITKNLGQVAIPRPGKCDSIIQVRLEYEEPRYLEVHKIFCDTSFFEIYGCTRFDFNHPKDTIRLDKAAATGCDSIIYINFEYQVIKDSAKFEPIDYNSSLESNGILYTHASVIRDTLTNNYGCDSISIATTVVFKPYHVTLDTNLCHGVKFTHQDKTYIEEGIYFDTVRNIFHLDSVYYRIAIKKLQVEAMQLKESYTICEKDSVYIHIENKHHNIQLNGENKGNSFYVSEAGEYIITSMDENNCINVDSFYVHKNSLPVIATTDMLNLEYKEPIPLNVNYSGNITQYVWLPATYLDCGDCPFPSITKPINSVYTITVKTDHDCEASASIQLTFKENKFSWPNVVDRSAEQNRSFYLSSLITVKYEMLIYDRWGNVMYKNVTHSNDSSGAWRPAEKLIPGVYTFTMFIEDEINGNRNIIGNITVL